MKILAIDTSSQICSTAILENDILIDKNELEDGYRVLYNYSYTDFTNDTLLLNNA